MPVHLHTFYTHPLRLTSEPPPVSPAGGSSWPPVVGSTYGATPVRPPAGGTYGAPPDRPPSGGTYNNTYNWPLPTVGCTYGTTPTGSPSLDRSAVDATVGGTPGTTPDLPPVVGGTSITTPYLPPVVGGIYGTTPTGSPSLDRSTSLNVPLGPLGPAGYSRPGTYPGYGAGDGDSTLGGTPVGGTPPPGSGAGTPGGGSVGHGSGVSSNIFSPSQVGAPPSNMNISRKAP